MMRESRTTPWSSTQATMLPSCTASRTRTNLTIFPTKPSKDISRVTTLPTVHGVAPKPALGAAGAHLCPMAQRGSRRATFPRRRFAWSICSPIRIGQCHASEADEAAPDSFSWVPLFKGKPGRVQAGSRDQSFRFRYVRHSDGRVETRTWQWIGRRRQPRGRRFTPPWQLFNLDEDPAETTDLAPRETESAFNGWKPPFSNTRQRQKPKIKIMNKPGNLLVFFSLFGILGLSPFTPSRSRSSFFAANQLGGSCQDQHLRGDEDGSGKPILKEMIDRKGNPVVCDQVWISYFTGGGDNMGEGFGKLTAGYGSGETRRSRRQDRS